MTMRANMTPRRLPLPPQLIVVRPRNPFPEVDAAVAGVGWTRKTFALAMHMACLWLFWLLVASPLVTSLRSGELAREFAPVVEAVRGWVGGH